MVIKNKKRFCLILSILFLTLIGLTSASLGISPGKVQVNFKPNLEETITFKINSDSPEIVFEIYVIGDLSGYVHLNKNEITGSGNVEVTLKLPKDIAVPGNHRILIGVKEKIDREVPGIGTAVIVQAPIDVFVPYPGRYLEIDLKSHNVNVGDPVNFELKLSNKGKENLNITPIIEIISGEETIETLIFQNRLVLSAEEITLRKSLETTDYAAGNYNALAIVDYGNIAKVELEFRIGSLFIDLLDYTKKVALGGVKKFEVGVESNWNNPIEGAHAEIVFLKDGKEFFEFKTSPSDLEPWEKETLSGFFETNNFSIGKYKTNITLIYYGDDIGKSSSEIGEVEFVKGKLSLPLMIIAISAIVIIAIVLIIVFIKKYLIKNAKRK